MTSGRGKISIAFILIAAASVLTSGQSQKSADEDASQPEQPVYDLGPGVIPPRVVKQANPKYSESSRGVRGTPKDPHVIRGIDDEVDHAAEALKQWRFAPARKNDKAVAVRVVVEIEFHGMQISFWGRETVLIDGHKFEVLKRHIDLRRPAYFRPR
jgi:hypothetical protein